VLHSSTLWLKVLLNAVTGSPEVAADEVFGRIEVSRTPGLVS
jgi:hypothetical protein